MADASVSSENAIVPQSNSGDASIDHDADGEFEVRLHYLGIPLKDGPCR